MVNLRQILGMEGEASAARFLKRKGYTIIEKNYRCSYGEIDLIVQDGDTLVFVEVKTRTSKDFGGPAAAVNHRKQVQISKTAHNFLTELKKDTNARFDVVSILMEKNREVQIDHLTNAFDFVIS
ncbi:YraN family protein [Desulforhopalus sp. 52FAK]